MYELHLSSTSYGLTGVPRCLLLQFRLLGPQVTLGPTVLLTLAQTAVAFFLAYRVTPTILALQMDGQNAEQQRQSHLPVPLQCGSPLRPKHAALLSCRPLALQVLLDLAMVAWPVGLSWAVDRRLRRQHAELCRERERQRGCQQVAKREVSLPDIHQPQQRGTTRCGDATSLVTGCQGGKAASLGTSRDQTSTPTTASVPLASQPSGSRLAVLPSSSTTRGRPSALYLSSMSTAVVSLKVRRAGVGVVPLTLAAAGFKPGGRNGRSTEETHLAVHGEHIECVKEEAHT